MARTTKKVKKVTKKRSLDSETLKCMAEEPLLTLNNEQFERLEEAIKSAIAEGVDTDTLTLRIFKDNIVEIVGECTEDYFTEVLL